MIITGPDRSARWTPRTFSVSRGPPGCGSVGLEQPLHRVRIGLVPMSTKQRTRRRTDPRWPAPPPRPWPRRGPGAAAGLRESIGGGSAIRGPVGIRVRAHRNPSVQASIRTCTVDPVKELIPRPRVETATQYRSRSSNTANPGGGQPPAAVCGCCRGRGPAPLEGDAAPSWIFFLFICLIFFSWGRKAGITRPHARRPRSG